MAKKKTATTKTAPRSTERASSRAAGTSEPGPSADVSEPGPSAAISEPGPSAS